jgi:hypothetical protein
MIIDFSFWALEHKDSLRVLRLQTLEINSVVKYSTHLDPSLVSGVQYASHTILQQVQTIWRGSIRSREREEFGKRDFWVFFVWPRKSFLGHCGGVFSVILFIGAWHELERRRAHCRLRIQPSGGSNLHHSA